MPPSSLLADHEIWDFDEQQKAKVNVFHQKLLNTSVYPSPVTFVDNAPVRENSL